MDPFQNGMDLDRLHALVISCYICLCHLALGGWGGSSRTHCKLQQGSQTWDCHQGNVLANKLVFGG